MNSISIIQFISLFLLMLVSGVFWGTGFSLSRSIEKLSAATFIENGKAFIKNLAMPMRILLPLTILFMLIGMWVYPDKNITGFYLNAGALLLIIMTLFITLIVEVPIDNQIKTWNTDTLPENWNVLRHRWQVFHTLRTFICIGSFLLLLASVLFY